MQRFAVQAGNGILVELVDEALSFGFEGLDCGVAPPFRVVASLIVVSSRGVKS